MWQKTRTNGNLLKQLTIIVLLFQNIGLSSIIKCIRVTRILDNILGTGLDGSRCILTLCMTAANKRLALQKERQRTRVQLLDCTSRPDTLTEVVLVVGSFSWDKCFDKNFRKFQFHTIKLKRTHKKVQKQINRKHYQN